MDSKASGMIQDLTAFIPALRQAAINAGKEILRFYHAADPIVWKAKADNSPVTEADLAADKIIGDVLKQLTPNIPVISEETFKDDFLSPPDGLFWLVDPLDGTREFLARTDDFTVNIALVADRQPVLGVIDAPVFGETFWGIVGQGAWREKDGIAERIFARSPPTEGLTVISSRYHGKNGSLEEFLKSYTVAHHNLRGSSYKFCEIASGKADLYPCLTRLHEWDIAAGQAIVVAAGGKVTGLTGDALSYGKPDLRSVSLICAGVGTRCI